MEKDEIRHINWMYNRLIGVYKENPNADYMIRFKEIIDKQLNLHVVGCSLTDKEKIDYELSQKQKIKHEEAKDWLHALWFVILIMFLFAIAVKGCS